MIIYIWNHIYNSDDVNQTHKYTISFLCKLSLDDPSLFPLPELFAHSNGFAEVLITAKTKRYPGASLENGCNFLESAYEMTKHV